MAQVHDVVTYFLRKCDDRNKINNLIYYAEAWHLVWSSKPLFNNEEGLNDYECSVLNAIWKKYGGLSLRAMTHETALVKLILGMRNFWAKLQ